jgi:hypothetical protein
MHAMLALYLQRFGEPFAWPVVRSAKGTERLDLKRRPNPVGRLGRLWREVASAERRVQSARFDAAAEIAVLQRERRAGHQVSVERLAPPATVQLRPPESAFCGFHGA